MTLSPLSLIVVLALSSGLAVFLFGLNIINRWRHRRLPGPRSQWLLGNGGTSPSQMGAPGRGHLAHQRWARAYGGIYVVFMGLQPQVVLTEASTGQGSGRPATPSSTTGVMVRYAPPMNKAIDGLIGRLGAASKGGVSVNMPDALAQMTMDVIGSTAFGVEFQAQQGDGHSKPLLEAAAAFFKPFEPASFAIMSMTAGIPGLREALVWLALKLRQPCMCENSRARALLWGATQQLLSNAGASAGAGTTSQHSGAERTDRTPGSKMEFTGSGNSYAVAAANGKLEEEQREEFEKGRRLCHHAMPSGASIIKLLSNARNAETGKPLRDLEVCSTMMTFLLAGYETTSLALSYALYELAKQPQLQARIAREVGGLGLPPGVPLDFAHLSRLPLTEACFSPGGTRACHCGWVHHPQGHVVFNTWALHHDPRHFPQPEEFRPERFLRGSEEAAKRHPFAYLPFGVGPRKCIGCKFAMEEGVLALARLLQRFEFEVDSQHHRDDPPGSALDLTLGITLTCRGGIWLRARRRPGWEANRED